MRLSAVLTMLGLVFAFSATQADEEKVAVDKLPEKVTKAIKDKFPKAELKSAVKDDEDGKVIYEVKIIEGKKKMALTLTADGKITEIETSIDPSELPKAVKEAIEKKYPKSKITEAEFSDEEDHKHYHIDLTTEDGKLVNLEMEPDGKVIKEKVKGKK